MIPSTVVLIRREERSDRGPRLVGQHGQIETGALDRIRRKLRRAP